MTNTLSPMERSILKALTEGLDEIQAGAKLHFPVNTVESVRERFGPDLDRIRQVLELDDVQRIPAPPTPIRPAMVRVRPLPKTISTPPVQQRPLVARFDPIEDLLAEAERHSLAKIKHKAERIRDQLAQLRNLIDEGREQEEARRQAEAEREAAQAEIAKLEAQLADLREKAGVKTRRHASAPNPKISAAASTNMIARRAEQDAWLKARGLTLSEALAWARVNCLQSRGSLLSKAAREAWDQANREGRAS